MNRQRHSRVSIRLMYGILAVIGAGAIVGLYACTPPQTNGYDQQVTAGIKEGIELLKKNQPELARVKFEAEIAGTPRNPVLYAVITQAYTRVGRHDQAIEYAERGIKATTGAPLKERAVLLTAAGDAYLSRRPAADYDLAVERYAEAHKLAPNEPAIMNNLGYAYAESPSTTREVLEKQARPLTLEAVRLAKEQSEPDVTVGTFLDSLGWVDFKLGNLEEAAANLRLAAELAPKMAEILFHCAVVAEARGKYEDAYTDLVRADNLDAANPMLSDQLTEMKKRLKAKLALPDAPK